MPESIACLAPRLEEARRAAEEIAERAPGALLVPCSLRGYLADLGAPSRIVLSASGPAERGLEFLRAAERRLLWPRVPSGLREAIGGLRAEPAETREKSVTSRNAVHRREPSAALLMEGLIDERRARAALLSSGPRDWVVESARHVRIPARWLEVLERAGIRWSALDPIEVVALHASPALARGRRRWSRLFSGGTPVWIRERVSRSPTRRRS
jgi:hypothetical protein